MADNTAGPLESVASDSKQTADNTASSMTGRMTGPLLTGSSSDVSSSLTDLISGLNNYAPDPSAKWLSFASNIAQPTKFGTLGEVVSNVASGLQPIVSRENELKNQYKMMAKQMMYQANLKDIPAYQHEQTANQLQTLQLLQALRSGAITQEMYEMALNKLENRGKSTNPYQPQGVLPSQQTPPVTSPGLPQSSASLYGSPSPNDATQQVREMGQRQVMPPAQPLQPGSGEDYFGLNENAFLGSLMPGEMGKAIVSANAPTDFTKLLKQSGIDPNSALGRQIMQAQIAKQNNIPLVSGRPGAPMYDPQGNVVAMSPKIPDNSIPQVVNGKVVGVQPLPNAQNIEQMNAYAATAGKNQAEPQAGFDSATGKPVFTNKLSAAQGIPTSGFPSVSAPVQNSRNNERIAILQSELAKDPNNPALISELARTQNAVTNNQPFSVQNGSQTQTGNVIPYMPPAQLAAAEANEKQLAEEASKLREASNVAVDTNYNLQQMKSTLQNFDTGKYTNFKQGISATLQAVLPDSMFPEKGLDSITNYQEFRKYSMKLGFDMARKMGARESTQIVQMAIDSNPNPELVKPAASSLLNGLTAQNDYLIAKAKAQDDYMASHKGTLGGFNSAWQSTANPMAFLVKYQTPEEQVKLFKTLSDGDKAKLADSITKLRKAGYL